MRCLFLFLFCMFSALSFMVGQAEDYDDRVTSYKAKIAQETDKKLRLLLLDSLSNLVLDLDYLEFETQARQTIDLALAIDSLDIAASKTVDLIHVLTNRLERPQDGTIVYENFLRKNIPISDARILATLHLRGASSYFYSGEEQKALELYDLSKKIAITSGDSTSYAKAMISKGFAYSEIGEFALSSKEYQKALQIFTQQKDTIRILTAKVGLSILYGKNAFHKESLEELQYVLNVARAINNIPTINMTLSNMALNHYLLGNYENTVKYLKESTSLSEDYPQYSQSLTHDYKVLSKAYAKLDSLELAQIVLSKIENILASRNDIYMKMNFWDAKLHLLYAQKNYLEAAALGEKLFELQGATSNYENRLSTLAVLSEVNHFLKSDAQELYYLKLQHSLKDSILNIQKTNSLSFYQMRYETHKRDAQIASQSTKIELLATRNKVQLQWFLLLAASLLLIGGWFYFQNKRNEQATELEKHKKALAEEQLKASDLERELLNKELEYKNNDLLNFALELNQNQKWAEVLLEKYEKIDAPSANSKEQKIRELGYEIRSKLQLNFESPDMVEKIEKVGSQFYEKLDLLNHNLSKNELRLCTLLRMKLDNKTIARLQNISPASVRTSRYRLRKKLTLKQEEDLDHFIINL